MHESLREIAYDRSEKGRANLLRLLTEQVFINRKPSEAEIEIFADIVARLLSNSPVEIRAYVSETVAERSDIPRGLVNALATDVVIVAAPVLRRSPILDDTDILHYAETLTIGHLVALAGRKPLRPNVTDVLIRRGDIIVFRTLAENAKAAMSAGSLHRLVEEADKDDDLCQHLSLRTDLSKEDAERVVRLVAKRLRGRMMVQPRKASIQPSPVQPPPVAAPIEVEPDRSVDDLLRDVASGRLSAESAIVALCRADRHIDLSVLFAGLANIDQSSVMKVLLRADPIGIINVLRAHDMGASVWREIAALRARRLRLSDAQLRFEIDDFDKVDPEEAKQLLGLIARKRPAGRRS